MGRFSPIKIATVLVIAIGYILLFGITERVDSIEAGEISTVSTEEGDTPPLETTDDKTQIEDADNAEITFHTYSSLDISNNIKPFEMNSAVLLPSGYEDILTEAETTADSTQKNPTETNEVTTVFEPDFVIDITTPYSAETSPESSSEANTTAPVTNPSGDTLSVRYTGSGGSVEGDAAEILAKVVMGEIGGGFDEEAIKAQAVAAYTYIKYYNKNGNAPNVSIKTPSDKVKKCVNEVLGQALYYSDNLIQAVYGASSAGYTASSKTVWGVDYPYLQSRKCELDALYDPNYGAKYTFTANEIRSYVRSETGIELDGDPGNWFAIKGHTDNVYVGSMSIGGKTSYADDDGKQIEITGKIMRERIMNYKLPSSCFEISYSSDTNKFTFTTYGYGHGVGLSQNGANNLAIYWKYDYRKILSFYFPGTELR